MFSALAFVALSVVIFQACTKDEFSASGSGEPQSLKVYLTDDPAEFDSLFVQINSVEVKLDTGKHRDDDDWGDRSDSLDKDDDDDRRMENPIEILGKTDASRNGFVWELEGNFV